MKWIPVEKRLPKIGEEVLCFYTIGESEYYVTGRIIEINTSQVSKTEIFRSIVWHSFDGEPFTPTHWCPMPKNPNS